MAVTGAEEYLVTYNYDQNNRLLTEVKDMGSAQELTERFYDNNGNQRAVSVSLFQDGDATFGQLALSNELAGITLYQYDGWNRQTSVTNGEMTATYTYLPNGQRHSKTVNGETTTQVWEGNQLGLELNPEGMVQDRYFQGIGLVSSDVQGYYLRNAHGDVVQLADASGNITKDYLYDAFGNERTLEDQDTNTFRYCGEYLDLETNTYYLRARNYSPTTGRFLSEDTVHQVLREMPNGQQIVDPLSLNLYTYCHNNPVMYVDENGHWIHIAAGALVGGVIAGGISAFSQWTTTGKIDTTKVAIATATGAVSGALAATGVGLVGQIIGNAALGTASSAVDQTYEILSNNYTRSEYDLLDIGISGVIGGVAGYVGGPGGGTNAVKALSNQTIKRISNAVNYQLGRGATKEIQKALAYYMKSSSTMVYREIIKSVVKASGVGAAQELIKGAGLQDKAKNELLNYATSLG